MTAAEVAGDLRRWTETVDRLVVVLASRKPDAALDGALSSPLLVSRGTRDGLTARATLVTGLPIELRVTTPDHWAAALLSATGSDAHLRALEPLARERAVDLERARGQDEAQLYRRLGLPYIPPELREGAGEVEAARAGTLPHDLVTLDDVQRPRPLPHRLLRRPPHHRGDGARRRRARHAVPDDHRPLPDRVLRQRPRRWTGCKPSGTRSRACRSRCRSVSSAAPSPTSWPTARSTTPTPSSSSST